MAYRSTRIGAAVFAAALCTATSLVATEPLSAIDWLEQRLPPQRVEPLMRGPRIDEPPVAGSVTIPDVSVSPLGAPKRGAAGLLPSSVTGLPRTLWSNSETHVLGALVMGLSAERQPALQSLLYTLLLAEADAPSGGAPADFIRLRVQKLLALGALDPASALLDRADPAHGELFDLYFDVALLSGDVDAPCTALRQRPALSRDLERRIFCDARARDWDTAALTLTTAAAIGALAPLDVALLERFLDPELFEDDPLPQPPARPTPLQFRLFEAIGEAMPTAPLPRAFAAVDLSGDAGWKAQADAAERLTRVGAISENRLLGIYTSRIPSASGGIWDRIEAVQRLETALRAGDPASILKHTETAWARMREVGLQVPFATLFGEALLRLPAARGAQSDLVTRIALLSPLYERAAERATDDPRLKAAQGIARGAPVVLPAIDLLTPIHASFTSSEPPAALTELARAGQLGEAILRAMVLASAGAEGDAGALQNGLAFLRSVGLEDTARRLALQLLLLDPEVAR